MNLLDRFRTSIKPPDWLSESESLIHTYRDHDLLLSQGEIVWAHIVQANSLLFKPGKEDSPAEIVFSLDRVFDEDIEALRLIAERIYDLKGNTYEDGQIDRLARMVSDSSCASESDDCFKRISYTSDKKSFPR